MVTPRKKILKPVAIPLITEEEKVIYREIVKYEAMTGKPWWTFAHPKESWASFKKRGYPKSKEESTMKAFDAKKVAQEIRSHLEAAVGDIASDMLSPNGGGFNDDKWDKKIKKARKQKVRDLNGWLADELYNDPDTLQDLMGDKLYEGCHGDKLKQLEVLNILRTNAHAGMVKACEALEVHVRS